MRILLDTQCWLWMESAPERLAPEAVRLLEDPANDLFLSSASVWEIAIKHALGKLRLPLPPGRYVPSRLARSGVAALPIQVDHALRAGSLPPHHRDPFDRMLVAQAQVERLAILTADPRLRAYGVPLIRT